MEIDTFLSSEFLSRFMNGSTTLKETAQVPPMPLGPVLSALASAYCILLIVGVLANLWTAIVVGCVLFKGDKEAPRNIQIYIFSLCCSNIVVLSSLSLLVSDLLAGYWVIGSVVICYFFLFGEVLNKFFGPFILAALSGTCCVSVCFRTPRSNVKQSRIAVGIVSGCFAVAVCLSSPVFVYGDVYYIVGYNGSNNEYSFYMPKCMFNPPEYVSNAFLVYTFVLGYATPALLFTLFYSVLLCFVKRHSQSTVSLNNSLYFAEVAKTTMGLVLFYLLCWTPYWSLSFYQFSGAPFSRSTLMTYVSYVIHLLPFVNCAGYPLIYTLLNKNIKKAYERVIRRHTNSMDGRSSQLVRLIENGCAFLFAVNQEESNRRRSTRTGSTFVSHTAGTCCTTLEAHDSTKSLLKMANVGNGPPTVANGNVSRGRTRSVLSV